MNTTTIKYLVLFFLGTHFSFSQITSNSAPPSSGSTYTAINGDRSVFIRANSDASPHRNENIYFQVAGNNWWDNTKLEIQREGGVGTRGGMFMDWGSLYLVANWDNTNGNEDIIFGFRSNIIANVQEKMRLTDSGRLGIGTSSPDEKLEVAGNIKTTGNISATGNISTTGTINATGTITSGEFNSSFFRFKSDSNQNIVDFEVKSNLAYGEFAMNHPTTGYYNTAIGNSSLGRLVGGQHNTAVGYGSGLFLSSSANSYNTVIGSRALQRYNGNNIIAIGYQALRGRTGTFDTTGNNHIAIGNNATIGLHSDTPTAPETYTNSIILGHNVTLNANNSVRIGNSSMTSIGGQVSWSTLSDGRFKKNLQENVPGLEFIQKLRPVTYTYDKVALQKFRGIKTENTNVSAKEKQRIHTGFIAQEVAEIAKEMNYEFSGVDIPQNDNETYNLRYAEFVIPLIKATQEQQAIIEHYKNELTLLKTRLAQIEKQLNLTDNTNNNNTGSQNNLKIYPNPANGRYTVDLPTSVQNGPFSVFIHNIQGKLILQQDQQKTKQLHLNISEQPAGVYVLKIITREGINLSKKIIKK